MMGMTRFLPGLICQNKVGEGFGVCVNKVRKSTGACNLMTPQKKLFAKGIDLCFSGACNLGHCVF